MKLAKREQFICLRGLGMSLMRAMVFGSAIWIGANPSAWVHGHEGHQPLPTKGVQIDFERGHITLSKQARDAIGVQTVELTERTVSQTIRGNVEMVVPWTARAFASAQISGRITRLVAKPGSNVRKGQVLAELTSRELELLKLEYQQARQELETSAQLLQIVGPSASAGAIPRQRLIEAENTRDQSAISLEIAKMRGQILGLDESSLLLQGTTPTAYSILSPIDGRIVHSDIAEGKVVGASEHLFEIVDNQELWGRIQLLERDMSLVRFGQKVEVEIDGLKLLESSTIRHVDVGLDPKTQSGWAWIVIRSQAALPGMVGTCEIQINPSDSTLAIPSSAVYSDGLQSYVFVEETSTKEAGEYVKKAVILGERVAGLGEGGPWVELKRGNVVPGDRIVIRGGHELSSLFFRGSLQLDPFTRERMGIQLEPAVSRSIMTTISVPAMVILPPESRSEVSTQIPGNIRSIGVTPGQHVKQGDVLFEISGTELQSLQLDLLRSSLEAQLFRNRFERLDAAKTDAISRRNLIETLAKAEQLESRVTSLKNQLATLGIAESSIQDLIQSKKVIPALAVRASIDGFVSRFNTTLGESIAAGQRLIEIQNLDQIWIEASIPVDQANKIALHAVGHVHALVSPDSNFEATVARIGPVVDAGTRVRNAWLISDSIPVSLQLRDGMLMNVLFRTQPLEPQLAVANSALIRDGLHWFVFVQSSNGSLERRQVTRGRSDDHFTQIQAGLAQGEFVVVSGSRLLQTAFAALR